MKINEVLKRGVEVLKENDVDYPKDDAFSILSFLTGKDRLTLVFDKDEDLDKNKEEDFFRLIQMRAKRKPIQYILGRVSFMGFDFKICEKVLIPRVDTEILVETVLKEIDEKNYKKICDVCTGSGAIGISIAKLREDTQVDLCDISDDAMKLTLENRELLWTIYNSKFYKSDLLSFALNEGIKYDVIVSNPPYIKTSEIENLMEDVKKYEPHLALDGGEDGLIFYKRIAKDSKHLLNQGGLLAFEIGYDQGSEVSDILKENGFLDIRVLKDLSGNDRVCIGFI